MAFFGLTALAGLDTDGPFRANVRSILNVRSKEDWVELFHLFHVYDADGNGMFDMQELRNLLTTYGNKEVPEHELHVLSKYLDRNGNGYITWDEFVDGIRGATEQADGSFVVPMTEYKSAGLFHADLIRHHRRRTGPQQQYKQPMLESHVVGWEEGLLKPIGETRFRHRTTDLSNFAAASAKQARGGAGMGDTRRGQAAMQEMGGMALGVL